MFILPKINDGNCEGMSQIKKKCNLFVFISTQFLKLKIIFGQKMSGIQYSLKKKNKQTSLTTLGVPKVVVLFYFFFAKPTYCTVERRMLNMCRDFPVLSSSYGRSDPGR